MKNIHSLKLSLVLCIVFSGKVFVPLVYGMSAENNTVTSPDGSIKVEVNYSEEGLYYNVFYGDMMIIHKGRLGIQMKDNDFASNLSMTGISEIQFIQDEYKMLNSKQKQCTYEANKKVFHFENGKGLRMDIIFQLSDDGVAFQYLFTDTSEEIKEITGELTSYHFLDGIRGWLQPKAKAKTGWGRCNPSYEEHYFQDISSDTSSPYEAGWVYPALFHYQDIWILITETNMDGTFCGTNLEQHSPDNEYTVRFPQKEEFLPGGGINPKSKLPWHSPWRIIAIGNLATIVESTLGTDLAGPAIDMDTGFIHPGRASWSWVLLKDDKTIYPVQKEFIDYAADMGWEYCLVDAGWDTQIGYDKIKELVDYGQKKGVGILLWYNSAGNWNDTPQTPRDLMVIQESRIKEFRRIKEMGVRGVKVDFFGGDGQSVMQYYIDILKDAAEVGLLVNFHGCTLPRGWHRTYPHLMSMESIKGFEFVTFEQGNADLQANHCTVIPFTRNVFDPMDFTPVCFSEVYNIERKTSNAFELALAVLFQSGIQHYAEIPEGMKSVPEYVKSAMQNIPVVWDEIKFIDGYPGKYAVMARKSGNTWYVAGINGENDRRILSIDLSFTGHTSAQIITDSENNRTFVIKDIEDLSHNIEVEMMPQGGFLVIADE